MSTEIGEYFVLKNLRNIVDIEDTLDDKDLNLFGTTANQDITNELFPWAKLLPFTEGTDLFDMCANAALYKVASLWKAKKENESLAKFYDKQFTEQMERIKTKLIKSPIDQERSRRASVTTTEVTKPLFSQTIKK